MTELKTSKPIKICFVAPKAYPLFNPDAKNVKNPFGGSEVDLYLLALELAKDSDFDVSFITADYGQQKVETIQNVKVIKSLDFEQNSWRGAIKIWRAMKVADAQIYFEEVASWGTFLIALFCKLNNKTFVYRTASAIECDGTYLKQHYFGGKAFAWSLKNAAQVVVQNETDAKKLKRSIGVDSIVIANAHYMPELTEHKEGTILWVGRSDQLKRPELFIKLAQMYPEEKFIMICPRALKHTTYDQLVDKAVQVGNLNFIKQVQFDKIENFYQQAKLFVCTSKAEGFPNTYVEACKCATPIFSLCVNPDNFLTTYKCGICADDNWGEFVQQLKILLESGKLAEYGENARKYAEQKHNITTIIKTYKELFLKLRESDEATAS